MTNYLDESDLPHVPRILNYAVRGAEIVLLLAFAFREFGSNEGFSILGAGAICGVTWWLYISWSEYRFAKNIKTVNNEIAQTERLFEN